MTLAEKLLEIADDLEMDCPQGVRRMAAERLRGYAADLGDSVNEAAADQLVEKWRAKAGERSVYGGYPSHSERYIQGLLDCADDLAALRSTSRRGE